MVKKTISLVIILVLAGGGFFYWWQNQADVRGLNKTLPEGVRVVKSSINDEYKVVNKIDGYSFKVPQEWKGVEAIEYIRERQVDEYNVVSMGLEGLSGEGNILSLDVYHNTDLDTNLEQWANNLFTKFGLVGEFKEEKINTFSIIKTKEEDHLGGTYVYFLKNDHKVYVFNAGSEEFIKEIILNGTW